MAINTFQNLIQTARFHFNGARWTPVAGVTPSITAPSTFVNDPFWSDEELYQLALRGATDMWGAIIDLHQEHYLVFDTTNVSYPGASDQLAGVPKDCFRVYLIEVLDPTTNQVSFIPRPYNHIEFINARTQTATNTQQFEPSSGVNIFYDVTGLGAPDIPPVIKCAPQLTTACALRFVYIPTLITQNLTINSMCPVPGESDNAIIAWIVAYARAKERADRSPDPAWISVYATEKQSLLTRMNPRQEQEAQYADGMFDGYWR